MADARITQNAIEVLSQPAAAARVTQDAIEVLSQPAAAGRVTQQVIEVLSSVTVSGTLNGTADVTGVLPRTSGLAYSGSGPPPIEHIATAGLDSTGPTTAAVDTTRANLLVFCIGWYAAGGSVTGPSDSYGNTWIPLTRRGPGQYATVQIWYAKNAIVGPGHTFSASGAGAFVTKIIHAFSAADTIEPVYAESGATTGASFGPLSTGNILYTDNSVTISAYVCMTNPGNSGETVTPAMTQTAIGTSATGRIVTGYQINYVTPGWRTPVWSWGGGNAGGVAVANVTFRSPITVGTGSVQYLRFRSTNGLFTQPTAYWMSLSGVSSTWVYNTMNEAEHPWCATGTLSDLYLRMDSVADAPIIFTVYKNGTPTSIQITIAAGALTGSDTTHSLTVVDGDLVCLQAIQPTGSSGGRGFTVGSVKFTSSVAGESVVGTFFSSSNMVSGGAGGQINPLCVTNGSSWNTSPTDLGVIPVDGVISDFRVNHSRTQGTGNAWVMVFLRNGVVQDGTSGTPDTRVVIGGGEVLGANTAFSMAVTAGDTLSIRTNISSGSVSTTRMGWGFKFVGATPGHSIVNVRNGSFYAGTIWTGIYGQQEFTGPGYSEASQQRYDFGSWYFKRLYVRPDGAWNGTSITITLRKNGVDTPISGTIVPATAGVQAVDIGDDEQVTTADQMTLQFLGVGSLTSRSAIFAYVLSTAAPPPPSGTGTVTEPLSVVAATGYVGDPLSGTGAVVDPASASAGLGYIGGPVSGTGAVVEPPTFVSGSGIGYHTTRLSLFINGELYNDWWWLRDAWDVAKDGPQETARFTVVDIPTGHFAKRVQRGDTFLITHPEGGLICGGRITETSEGDIIESVGTTVKCTGGDWMFMLSRITVFPQVFFPQEELVFWQTIYEKYLAPLGWTNLSPPMGGMILPELVVEKPIPLKELLERVEEHTSHPVRVNGMMESAMVVPGELIWPYGELNGDNAKMLPAIRVEEEVLDVPTRYIMEGIEPPSGKGPYFHHENRWVINQRVCFPVNVLPTKIEGKLINDVAPLSTTIQLKELPAGARIRWADAFFINGDVRRYHVGAGSFTVNAAGEVTIACEPIELEAKKDTTVTFQEGAMINLKVNGVDTAFDGGESGWVWDKTENQFVHPNSHIPEGTKITYEAWIVAPWIMRAWETSDPQPVAFHGGFDYSLIVDEVLDNKNMYDPESTVRFMREKLIEPVPSKRILKVTTHTHGLYPYLGVSSVRFPRRRAAGKYVVERVQIRSNGADPNLTLNDLEYNVTLRKDIYGRSMWGFFTPVSKIKWGPGTPPPCGVMDVLVISEDFGDGVSLKFDYDNFDADGDPGDYWEDVVWYDSGGGATAPPPDPMYPLIRVTECVTIATDGRGYGGRNAVIGHPGFRSSDGADDPWGFGAVLFSGCGNLPHGDAPERGSVFFNATQMYALCYYSFTTDALTNNGDHVYGDCGHWPYEIWTPWITVLGAPWENMSITIMMHENAGNAVSYVGLGDSFAKLGSGMSTDPIQIGPDAWDGSNLSGVGPETTIAVIVSVYGYSATQHGNVIDNAGTVFTLRAHTGTPGGHGVRIYMGHAKQWVPQGDRYEYEPPAYPDYQVTYYPAVAERATMLVMEGSDASDIESLSIKRNTATTVHTGGVTASASYLSKSYAFLISHTPGNSGFVSDYAGTGFYQYYAVDPTNAHAALYQTERSNNTVGVFDPKWTSAVPATTDVISFVFQQPLRYVDCGHESIEYMSGWTLNVMYDAYLIDPITGYWDWVGEDGMYGIWPFSKVENLGPMKCVLCYRCGTYHWDPDTEVEQIDSDGWLKVVMNNEVLVEIEGIPLWVSDGTYGEDHVQTMNLGVGAAYGWYGLPGELSTIRVSVSPPNAELPPPV